MISQWLCLQWLGSEFGGSIFLTKGKKINKKITILSFGMEGLVEIKEQRKAPKTNWRTFTRRSNSKIRPRVRTRSKPSTVPGLLKGYTGATKHHYSQWISLQPIHRFVGSWNELVGDAWGHPKPTPWFGNNCLLVIMSEDHPHIEDTQKSSRTWGKLSGITSRRTQKDEDRQTWAGKVTNSGDT